ncbi:hypothetical protein PSPO01_14854 [Paraphaeosphaeria sporulosa]
MLLTNLLVFGVAVTASPYPQISFQDSVWNSLQPNEPCVPLDSGIINNRGYKRIIATCIEQPQLDFSKLLPWTLCTIVKDEIGLATRTCDLDNNLGRLENVCVKNGCMANTPDSWQ